MSLSNKMTPVSVTTVQSWLQRRDLIEADIRGEMMSYAFASAPFGALYAVSNGFWFASPAKTVMTGLFTKGAAFGNILKVLIIGAYGAAYQGTAVLSAQIRHKNDALNQALGGFIAGNLVGLARRIRHVNELGSSVRHGLFYGWIYAGVAAFATEAFASHYDRLSKPFDPSRRLPGFLAVPNDPFAKREEEMKAKHK